MTIHAGRRRGGTTRRSLTAVLLAAGVLITGAPAAQADPPSGDTTPVTTTQATQPAQTSVSIFRNDPNRSYYSPKVTELRIAVSSADGTTPSGTVKIYRGGRPMAVQRLDADGRTVYVVPKDTGVGTHAYHAVFTPTSDWKYTVASSQAVNVYVHPASVKLMAQTSPAVTPYGQTGRVHVQVNNPDGFIPSGTVRLMLGSTIVSTGTLNARGAVALPTNRWAGVGTQKYTVQYLGNSSTRTAQVTRPVEVRKVTPTVTFSLSTRTPSINTSVRADIQVTDSAGTVPGAVRIKVGSKTYGPIPLTGGKATYSFPAGATTGQAAVMVQYVESANYRTAWSAGQAIKINPPAVNPCPATARACVNLSNETAWLQVNGKITYGPVPMTAGRAGHRTNPGMHTVFWRHKDHYSSIFNGAPMPNSVFFDGGIAFHQGSLYVQSHGCIHLSWSASETFFNTLKVGDKVYVFGKDPY